MRRQVDYHLAHARAAASGATPGARCSRACVGGRTRRGRCSGSTPAAAIAIDVHVDAAHAVRGQREDLDEMLGNLLDNACKWATARVAIASSVGDSMVVDHGRRRRTGVGRVDAGRCAATRCPRRRSGAGIGLRPRDRARSRGGVRRFNHHRPRPAWRLTRAADASRFLTLRISECGMRNAECGMRNAECGMRIRNAIRNPQSAIRLSAPGTRSPHRPYRPVRRARRTAASSSPRPDRGDR